MRKVHFFSFFCFLILSGPARAEQHTPDRTLPLSATKPFSYAGQLPWERHKAAEDLQKDLIKQLDEQPVLITRSRKGEQIGWAKTCELLKAEVEPLRYWQAGTDFLDPRTPQEIERDAKCTYSKQHGLYWMNLGQFMPRFSSKCLGFDFACEGPNCMNAALLTTGTCKAVRYSSPDELMSVLNSSVCTNITDAAELKPGDVISIGGGKPWRPVHAFVYVSANLAFEKPTSKSDSVHRFVSPETILKNWGVPKECFIKATPEKCPELRAQAHHCETSSMISAILSEDEPEAVKDVRRAADDLELEHFDDYFFNTFLAPTLQPQDLQKRVQALLKSEVLEEMPAEWIDEQDAKKRSAWIERWRIQRNRVKSMLTQTEYLVRHADEESSLQLYESRPLKVGAESLIEKLETRSDAAVTFPFINAIAQKMRANPEQTFAAIQRDLPAVFKAYDEIDLEKNLSGRHRAWQVRRSLEIAAEVAEQLSTGKVRARISELKPSIGAIPVKTAKKIQ